MTHTDFYLHFEHWSFLAKKKLSKIDQLGQYGGMNSFSLIEAMYG